MVEIRALLIAAMLIALTSCNEPSQQSAMDRVLQQEILRDRPLPDPREFQRIIPYKMVVFERTGCFGPCEPYRMTIKSDGYATLVTFPDAPDKRKTSTSYIGPSTFSRIVQLLEQAKPIGRNKRFKAQWTDASAAKITVMEKTETWTVYDYGEVAPLAIWELEVALHAIRHNGWWEL